MLVAELRRISIDLIPDSSRTGCDWRHEVVVADSRPHLEAVGLRDLLREGIDVSIEQVGGAGVTPTGTEIAARLSAVTSRLPNRACKANGWDAGRTHLPNSSCRPSFS